VRLADEGESHTDHGLVARIKVVRFAALKSFDTFNSSLVSSLEKGRVLDLWSGAFTKARGIMVRLGASGARQSSTATWTTRPTLNRGSGR
jgi:hypothetical protein